MSRKKKFNLEQKSKGTKESMKNIKESEISSLIRRKKTEHWERFQKRWSKWVAKKIYENW